MTTPSKKRDRTKESDDKFAFGKKTTDAKFLDAVAKSQKGAREQSGSSGSSPTSIRLPKELIAKLKALAKRKSLPYQTYVRMILTEHVTAHGKERRAG